MRITLNLPKELIEKAMKLTGETSVNQLVKSALQSEINRQKRKRLISKKGTIDLEIDLDTLRERD